MENAYPEAHVLALGDFNHYSLSSVLPKFKQQVHIATRGNRVLDYCYCTLDDAYRAVDRAPLGLSDHCMVHLLPRYRQKLKTDKPVVRASKCWNSESILQLQDCLALTDWDTLKDNCTDVHEHRRRNRGGKGGARPPTFQGGGAEGGLRPPTFGLAHISRSRQDPSSFTHTIPQY